MRFTPSTLAALGLLVAVYPFAPPASVKAADALNAAQAEKLTADSAAARALIESGGAEEVAWSWFVWLNMPLTGAAPKTWEGWRPTSTVYLPDGQAPAAWGQTPAPPTPVIAEAQKQGLNTNLPFHNLD